MKRALSFVVFAFLLTFGNGCASPRSAGKPFRFGKDSFAFRNDLQWTYEFREDGKVITKDADPPPKYPLRCFPITRTTREFFYHARFAPELPKVSDREYAALVKKVVGRNSRRPAAPEDRIVIPGYADLFSFGAEHEAAFRRYCGGPVHSYLQRGNWRMIFPVPRWQNRRTAQRLVKELQEGRMRIVHVYRFPDVKLNHGILLYEMEEKEGKTLFRAYDPNNPERPAELTFDSDQRAFFFERNQYFAGGRVEAFEVYHGCCY